MNQTELRDILVSYFNDSELRDLCFDLGIEYENLGGDNKSAKARELVAYCQRRNRLPELETACRRQRPTAFTDNRAASAEAAHPAPGADRPPTSTIIPQSGGVTINAQTVNITGDVTGRDKTSTSGSDSDQSLTSA